MRKKGLEVLQISLPDYLADWLIKISEDFAMTPSQFLANLLQHYYEIYKKGAEKQNSINTEGQTEDKDLVSLAEKFINQEKLKGKQYYHPIARKFALWVKDKISDISELNESLINTFLEEYAKEHNLHDSTVEIYHYVLKKFVSFVLENMKKD